MLYNYKTNLYFEKSCLDDSYFYCILPAMKHFLAVTPNNFGYILVII